MDTTTVSREQSGGQSEPSTRAGASPSWPSQLYDEMIREALGEDALRQDEPIAGSLSGTDILRAYAVGRVSRTMDVRERALQAQGRAWFAAAGAGREVIGWAFARYLTPHDPKMPYYRDRTLQLCLGVTPEELFLQTVGAATDPASGGRQMPSHWGSRNAGVIAQSSPTGSQAIAATGLAEGIVRAQQIGVPLSEPWSTDSVVYCSIGDGSTAEGEVEEAIRQAARTHAPVIFLVEDDRYAISVPVTWNVPGGDIYQLYRHYEEFGALVLRCDGTDPVEADEAVSQAVDYARGRRGPVILHALVTRHMSHSSTDTQDQYRTPEELAEEAARDPLLRLSALLRDAGLLDDERQAALDDAAGRLIAESAHRAVEAPRPDTTTILRHVTACDLQDRGAEMPVPEDGESIEMRYALNRALKAAMEADPRIVVYGEDVADAAYPGLPGKGGVFHVTRGLQFAYPQRVWNSALAEATIVGTAMGESLAGLLPVVEIQFRDYLHPAWQQLVDEASTLRWRSNGVWACPMVIRMAYGGYLGGAGAIWHSESNVGMISTIPGIRIVCPSNATDAAGLLRTAIESGDIVLLLEPKAMYARKAPYPGDDYRVPLGVASVRRTGTDVTIVCWGNLVPRALQAADALASDGIEAEVIDLRTVDAGWDAPAVLASVDRTGSLLVAEEDRLTGGFGATIAARAAEDLPGVLIARLAAKDCRVAYGPEGERAVLPQVDDIIARARHLVEG
ncbi:MAG TPA: thiamine pyrophosphate-dependent enzyme [Chloroflexota bacterium]